MHIHMSSRNLAIRKDVCDALEREKKPGESFTGVLERLLAHRSPLEELYGAWGAAQGEDARLLRVARGRLRRRRS